MRDSPSFLWESRVVPYPNIGLSHRRGAVRLDNGMLRILSLFGRYRAMLLIQVVLNTALQYILAS